MFVPKSSIGMDIGLLQSRKEGGRGLVNFAELLEEGKPFKFGFKI